MSYTTKINWEPLRTIDSATLTGVFVPLGAPLAFASYICKIVNNSTSIITISIDGVTAVDVVPAGSFFLYDEGKGSSPYNLALPASTQIYIKGNAGTGLIYLVSQYIMII